MNGDHESGKMPLVAVIVPVYNDELYLRNCLDSIKNQTASFWEAWVIDDCSQDGSADIIREYCAEDPRFHALHNEANSSAWASRAKGILSVSPSVQYIMFADADDSLQLHAVERAYRLMQDDPVDILHFGTNIGNFAGLSSESLQKFTANLQPLSGRLEGREIFDHCVVNRPNWSLWNKMFRAGLLREVIQNFGVDRVLPRAQDKVLYWAVCWQKEDLTYRGVEDRLYNYNYGLGEDGRPGHITLEQYRQYLAVAWSADAIAEIMAKHPQEAVQYAEALEASRLNLMRNTVHAFTRLPPPDWTAGMDLVSDYWQDPLDGARFASAVAEYTYDSQLELADSAAKSRLFATEKKGSDIRVIGTYYYRLHNGGIQRVIAQLMPVWHELGYEIVIFTDHEPDEDDYAIPDYVKRAAIGYSHFQSSYSEYVDPGMSLARLLAEYKIDCMVYHACSSEVLLYDMLVCKSMNIPFFLYEHNVFSVFARYADTKFSTVPILSQLADGLLCLDDTSAVWWRHFNHNVHTVLNPLTFSLPDVAPAERSSHNILFLCRLDEYQKRPYDAVTIIQGLVPLLPDVKLYMVGTGENTYVEDLRAHIAGLGLQDHIVMAGFTTDVEEYYRKCSVFLMCSAFEGAPMSLCEALSFGLPVVMYDLPYLRLAQNNPGIFAVRQRDTDAAVRVLYQLLTDPDRLRAAGDAGRRYLEEVYSADLGQQWKTVFDSVDSMKDTVVPGTTAMCHMLVRDYYESAMQVEKQRAQMEMLKPEIAAVYKKIWSSQGELDYLKRSVSFRLGRSVTAVPRKVRDGLKRILPKELTEGLKK